MFEVRLYTAINRITSFIDIPFVQLNNKPYILFKKPKFIR